MLEDTFRSRLQAFLAGGNPSVRNALSILHDDKKSTELKYPTFDDSRIIDQDMMHEGLIAHYEPVSGVPIWVENLKESHRAVTGVTMAEIVERSVNDNGILVSPVFFVIDTSTGHIMIAQVQTSVAGTNIYIYDPDAGFMSQTFLYLIYNSLHDVGLARGWPDRKVNINTIAIDVNREYGDRYCLPICVAVIRRLGGYASGLDVRAIREYFCSPSGNEELYSIYVGLWGIQQEVSSLQELRENANNLAPVFGGGQLQDLIGLENYQFARRAWEFLLVLLTFCASTLTNGAGGNAIQLAENVYSVLLRLINPWD